MRSIDINREFSDTDRNNKNGCQTAAVEISFLEKDVTDYLSITIETFPKGTLSSVRHKGINNALHKCHTPRITHPHGELLFGCKNNTLESEKLKKLLKELYAYKIQR